MPEIFVVNPVSSAARRANISRQLADLGLAFTLFPAVDGRKEEHRLCGKYDNERNQHYRGQALSRGQLGCYASHYLLWQKCVELDHPVVVLEDDALIYPEPFSEFVNNLDALSRQFDCVRLFDNKRKAFSSRRVSVLNVIAAKVLITSMRCREGWPTGSSSKKPDLDEDNAILLRNTCISAPGWIFCKTLGRAACTCLSYK